MKKQNIIAGLVAIAFTFTACENFLDVNESPNQAENAPVSTTLTAAFSSLIVAHTGHDARLAGMWTRQFTGQDRQYSAYNVYNMNAEDFEFDIFYYGICEQSKIVGEKAAADGNAFYAGVAKVLQAHSYGMIASLWGDVPFSEANKFPEIQNPKFDGQVSVYAGVQSLLDAAITDLNGGGGDAGGVDIFFGGDAAKWIQVANTLKARFYMHTGQYANAVTAAQSGITSSADNWNTVHTGGAYNQDMNIYHSFEVFDRAGYMGATNAHLPSLLDASHANYRGHAKTDESARFATHYTAQSAAGAADWNVNYSSTSLYFTATSPFPLVTAVENHLIMAEANARQNQDANALTNLNNARTELASIFSGGTYAAFALSDFDPTTGIEDNGQGSQNANLIYEILEEKYASLIGQIEAFNDVRRTDNMLGISPTTGSSLPERYLIPQDELNSNSNAPASIPGLMVPTAVNN